MPSAVHILLGNTAVALAIALAALLALLLRRPALSHVLWLLVLVKLVAPPLLRVPMFGTSDDAPDARRSAAAMHRPAADAPPHQLTSDLVVAAFLADPSQVRPSIRQEPAAPLVSHSLQSRLPGLLAAAWLIGSAAYITRTVLRTRRWLRVLEAAQPVSPATLAHVRELAGRLGLKRVPDVRIVRAAMSPMVIGTIWRSRLALPAALVERLGTDELRAVIAHELAHLRRGDHVVRWLEVTVTALAWWHPLVWLARRGLHEAEEQCCDAWVVWTLPESRRAYADALVTTAALASGFRAAPAAAAAAAVPAVASGLGQFQQLRRRVVMIMQRRTRRGMSALTKCVATAAMLAALPILPAVAEKPSNSRVAVAAARAEEPNPPADAPPDDAKAGTPKKQDADPAGAQAPREQIEREKAKARARMRQDGRKYSAAELQDAEALYQVANKSWRSPEAKQSLETMVKKYPKFNRTGCAILYLGQYSKGEDREKYLKQAVEQFSDCFYGNGVQVGAFARYLLASHYRENGDLDKGNTLLKELIQKYPTAVTHQGDQLAKIAKEDLNSAPAPK